MKFILSLVLFLSQSFGEHLKPNKCSEFYAGWEREFMHYTVEGKKIIEPPNRPVQYHLFLIEVDSLNKIKISDLPAYIQEKQQDTSYSSSDGGFRNGKGDCNLTDSSVVFSGRYYKYYYYMPGKRDSSFNFELIPEKMHYREKKSGVIFKSITKKEFYTYESKWGIKRTEHRKK